MNNTESLLVSIDAEENTHPIGKHVLGAVENYFSKLSGEDPCDLYKLVLQQVEAPLFKTVMKYVKGNQSKAAEFLGLSRGTVRKKLKEHSMLKEGKNR